MSDTPSLRDSLEANFDKIESVPAEPPAAAPVETAPAAPQITEAPPSADPGRPRDELGRFKQSEVAPAKPEPGPAKVEAKGKATGAVPAPAAPVAEPVKPPDASLKAPQSWKPQAREAFAKAPPEVQAEVARREAEITQALQQTAQARQFAQRVQQSLSPYETIARANGTDALTYAGNVLQTAAVLQMGTPQQRASALAQVVHQYGVDVTLLAQALDATPSPQQGPWQATQPPYQPPMQDTRAQIQEMMVQMRADQDLQAFLATKPEFVNDVWQDMQAIFRATPSGSITFEQAYNRACRMNEDVWSIIQQREAAKAARTAQAATEKARAAASSVRSQPTAAPKAQPTSLRAQLEASYDELAGR